MTRLINDPRDFAREMTAGFVAAHPSFVRGVDGGVVRAAPLPEGAVAVVIGGGSGHYPAFAGLVGEGLGAGAAMGNVFASPSADAVESVARSVHRGGGILLTYGNYAGDVLNFDEAQESLRAAGIPCETVVVTDDISSAPPEDAHLRRGIAGDLVVFKCAGAAAEAGYGLGDVARVARAANERTRTLGVALTGCTLPGATEPLFTIPPGRMGLGMGIHGEPGIAETELPSADGVADILVDRLLAEAPAGADESGRRVVPILNGLGATKYEELFVVYRRVAERLLEHGWTVVDPHVGEYCTSFEMSGLSLTLFWPDDELDELWRAPAYAPAFRRGSPSVAAVSPPPQDRMADIRGVDRPAGSDASRELARRVVALLEAAAVAVEENAEEFGRLDAVAGDGDHGIGMRRGVGAALDAARAAAADGAGAGSVLREAGTAWARDAGGTSGALWGGALRELGRGLGDRDVPDPPGLVELVGAAAAVVRQRGGARVGDKTMVDALDPYVGALAAALSSGASLTEACNRAAEVAADAAAATAGLIPRLGRARPHAERSLGVPDPGAHSFAVIVSAVARSLGSPAVRGG